MVWLKGEMAGISFTRANAPADKKSKRAMLGAGADD
jgi:hypothetical protein